MKNYFEKYFDIITLNINKNFENPNITDIEKNKLSIYLEIIEDLKKNMLWQATSIHEKQSNRIMWLASMRKSEAPVSVIEKQKKTINVYERINNTIPFLLALNVDLNKPLIDFLKDICERIDFLYGTYKGSFPKATEIEEAFKIFFEIVQPAQGNGDMFKECYERIENLYTELKKLDSE